MGIAKTINALGEYNLYSADYITFVETISRLFKVNLSVSFCANIDEEGTEYDRENEFFDFNQNEVYRLTVNFWKIDDNKPLQPNNVYCDYEMIIPVNLEYEKELLLQLYSNGIFQLNFIPLSNMWQFFIGDILGVNDHYHNSHLEVVKEKNKIRNCYINILKKLNCNRVILWTDAYYKTEGEITEPNKTLNDLIKHMQDTDKLKIYNFADILNQKIMIIRDNKNDGYLDIALLDNFDDKIETTSR